jgi:hypothetical protein
MAELGGVEADGDVGLDRSVGDLAARGVDAGSDVGGDHRRGAGVDGGDRRARRGPRGPGEAGAEDRIDDRARLLEDGTDGPARLANCAVEAPEIHAGVAGELGRRPQQQGLDVEPGLR